MPNNTLPMFDGSKFEEFVVDRARVNVSASLDSNQIDIPIMPVGADVQFICRGHVQQVNHVQRKDQKIERRHVIVVDAISFGEGPPERKDNSRKDSDDEGIEE